MKSFWHNIVCDYEEERTNIGVEDDTKRIISIDAWKTADDNEEGKIIAQVILTTQDDICVAYHDNIARADRYAQEVIQEAITKLKNSLTF